MSAFDVTEYLADSPPIVARLEIEKPFESLTKKQKRYAHFISQASFAGTRIILRQRSPESEPIFDFILALHKSCGGDWKALAAKAGVGADELAHFLHYAAQFLANLGNYKSYGDVKFVPRCAEATLSALADAAGAEAQKHHAATGGAVFAAPDKPALMHLGFPEDGHMTTYYPDSPDITKAEIEAVTEWMNAKGLMAYNTRLRKAGPGRFQLLIASARTTVPDDGGDMHSTETRFKIDDGGGDGGGGGGGGGGGVLAGAEIEVVYGDYSAEMARMVALMRKAADNADNETQEKMHLAYANSFENGSLQAFKESQRLWIRDQGPVVECNIGFIETYQDPAGIRGEFEGFAAIVNMERTRAFGGLVNSAPRLIPMLPWPKEFETDKFLAPDFTSLEVLTMCSSGIPLGINLPNYGDIKQEEGFKNVSLGNVQNSSMPNKLPFIRDCDLDLFTKTRTVAFEIHVGLHELMGHGCGKLLRETSAGEFNFDKQKPPVNPVTGKPITSWYKPGESWGSVFKGMAGAYEECRAELVGLYLICDAGVLNTFGVGDGSDDIMSGKAGDVLYTSYLTMAMAGLTGIEFWDPKSQKWGQAHCQARFAILRTLLDAGDDFCKLEYTKDDLSDLKIHLDRTKILTTGRKAVGNLLRELHIYKSTGDAEAGTRLFRDRLTRVDPDYWGSKVRGAVIKNKQPRRLFVQATTVLDEATGEVALRHYDATPEGMVQSWADREDLV